MDVEVASVVALHQPVVAAHEAAKAAIINLHILTEAVDFAPSPAWPMKKQRVESRLRRPTPSSQTVATIIAVEVAHHSPRVAPDMLADPHTKAVSSHAHLETPKAGDPAPAPPTGKRDTPEGPVP